MIIQVKHQPRKQVIIHEMAIYDSAQQLIDISTTGIPAGTITSTVKWANGVLISYNPLPVTDFISQERTKGILHWDHVSFAPLKKFTPQIISQNNIAIDIVDVSKNETFQSISKFLLKKLKK